jgi:hypothetical protein
MESVAGSFEVCRHPRDPTFAVGEDDLQETGYMLESEMTKSCIGIKHSRSQSVLLHCDAEKLLHVSRGLHSHTFDAAECGTELRREYVEEAQLIHEDVFDELQRVFSDVLQPQRLLLLDNVKQWDGWAHQIHLHESAAPLQHTLASIPFHTPRHQRYVNEVHDSHATTSPHHNVKELIDCENA